MSRLVLGLAAAGAFGLAACTETTDTTTDDTTTPTAVIGMTVTPDPASAMAPVDGTFAWMTPLNVAFAESGGVGVTVNSITVTMQESSGGIVLGTVASDKIKVELDTTAGNKIAANTTLNVGVKVHYTLPNGGREGIITVQASLTDDNEHTGSFNGKVTVK